jgi:hypothetical protein
MPWNSARYFTHLHGRDCAANGRPQPSARMPNGSAAHQVCWSWRGGYSRLAETRLCSPFWLDDGWFAVSIKSQFAPSSIAPVMWTFGISSRPGAPAAVAFGWTRLRYLLLVVPLFMAFWWDGDGIALPGRAKPCRHVLPEPAEPRHSRINATLFTGRPGSCGRPLRALIGAA